MSMEIVKQIRNQIAFHHMEIERLSSALDVIEQVSGKALPVAKKDQPLFSVRRIAAAPQIAPPTQAAAPKKEPSAKGGRRIKKDKKIDWKETVQNVLKEHDTPLKSGDVIDCLDIKRDDKQGRQSVYNALSWLTVNGHLTRDEDSYYHFTKKNFVPKAIKTVETAPAESEQAPAESEQVAA